MYSVVHDVEADDHRAGLDIDGGGDDGRDVHHAAPFADPLGQHVDPQIAIRALVERSVPELGDDLVELAAMRETSDLEIPSMPMALTRSSPGGWTPLHVGRPDHRHQGLLGRRRGWSKNSGL